MAASNPRPIPESYWVLPGRFLAGEYPGNPDPQKAQLRLQSFLAQGFTHFFDLTQPGENGLEPYAPLLEALAPKSPPATEGSPRWDHLRFPLADFRVPPRRQMKAVLDAIDQALAGGSKVYLHCFGGVGRTGTVVGCYLVRHGLTGPRAAAQLAAWWKGVPKAARNPDSPETKDQLQLILEWSE